MRRGWGAMASTSRSPSARRAGVSSSSSTFAARLIDTVLGGRGVFSAARVLGPAEFGILAGVLAPAFDRIGGGVHIGARPPRSERDRQAAASISFRLETAVATRLAAAERARRERCRRG